MTTIASLPDSRRYYVAGPTGSGKSHLLRVWAGMYPRQLVLDTTGEWSSPEGFFNGEIQWAGTAGEVSKALKAVADFSRWRVVVPTERLEAEQLIQLLVPIHRPGRSSFPRAVGGMALIVDEAAELSPNNPRAVRPVWLRGRHHGLSVLAASQRAADVGRMVTSQSEWVAVTQTTEPLDLAYWRGFLSAPGFEALLRLGAREAVRRDRVTQREHVITTDGRILREIVRGTV